MALSPLEALRTLMSGSGRMDAMNDPSSSLLKNNPAYKQLSPVPTEEYGWSGAVPTQGELSSPWEQEQTRRADAANARDRVATQDVDASNLKAILSGYGGTTKIDQGPLGYSASGPTESPAARMAEDARNRQMQIARIPVETAGISAGAQRDVANIQGGTQREIEGLKERAETSRSDAALKRMLGIQLEPGDALSLPGGAKLERKSVPLPTGKPGENVQSLINERMQMEGPPTAMGNEWLGNFLGTSPVSNAEKAIVEQQLDAQFPAWRAHVRSQNPGFKFATGGGPLPLTAPGQAVPGQQATTNQQIVPTAPRMTKPLRDGGIAYSDDGGKSWYRD